MGGASNVSEGGADLNKVALAEMLSSIGTGVSILALPTVAVLVLDATPLGAAGLLTAELAPAAVVAPMAGSLIDRLSRIRLAMIVADFGRALALIMIPLLAESDALRVWHMYVVAAVIGGLTPFSSIGGQSLIPRLVKRQDALPRANSLVSGAVWVGMLVGPTIGGVLIGSLGAVNTVYVDAASYVFSAIILSFVHERVPQLTVSEEGPGRGIWPAVAIVRRSRLLRRVIFATAALNVCGSAIGGLFILYAYRFLGLTPRAVGLTFTVAAIAGIGGAFVAGWYISRFGLVRSMLLAAVAAASSFLLIPSAMLGMPIYWLAVYQAVFTASATVLAISAVTVRQMVAPPSMRGRVNAVAQSVSTATIPAGALLGGVVAGKVGVVQTLTIFALLAPVSWIALIGAGSSTEQQN